MTYYALHDIQSGFMLATGRNATSKDELLNGLRTLISVDIDGDEKPEDFTLEDILEGWEYELIEKETPFPRWEDEA